MTVKNGSIGFELKLPDRLANAGLPIEVRGSNRKLVGRYDAGDKVDVEPGSYYISVRLPSGEELTDWVDVVSGRTVVAELSPDDDDGGDESQFVFSANLQAPPVQRPAEGYVTPESFVRLQSQRAIDPTQPIGVQLWSGTIGKYKLQDASALTVNTKRGLTSVVVPPVGGTDQLLLQLIIANRAGTVLVLPRRPGGPEVKAVIAQCGDELAFDAHLDNELADVMIRDTTEVKRTQRVAQAMDMRGLLNAKVADPIAAAAGAVALLGIDQAERVHDWLRNLADYFAWLPDAAALAAEACAREGKHDQAIELLMMLEHRGVPLFSDSLGFALDRLGRYARHKTFRHAADMERVLVRLRPFGGYRLSGRALTTFRALDPNEPSDKKCGPYLPDGARAVNVELRAQRSS